MDQGPLVSEQIAAGARFLGEFHKLWPVRVAFWLQDSEDGGWSLYVASDRINDNNYDLAYGDVARLAWQYRDPWFDPMQIKVLGSDDPLAKAALDVSQRFPSRTAGRVRGQIFGGISVKDVYIYPSPLAMAAGSG